MVGLRNAGIVLANTCGPCIGQWDGQDVKKDENNTTDVPSGYDHVELSFQPPPEDCTIINVAINRKSDRLQLWTGAPTDFPILMKFEGKYTSGHVPAGGPGTSTVDILIISFVRELCDWCSQHREKRARVNKFKNKIIEYGQVPSPQAAAGIKWVVIGDRNYDEGSLRERAALELRLLGGLTIITCSFARIHRTNSKKQDILALTFADPVNHDRIQPNYKVDIVGLDYFASGRNLTLIGELEDGMKNVKSPCLPHTFNKGQIKWFKPDSALNLPAADAKAEAGSLYR
ncbi:hypothetical protein H1R20_g12643, partial [Candolleomyces eurysporus]